MKLMKQLASNVYNSKPELEEAIKRLGDLNRAKKRHETEVNDKIATLQQGLAEVVQPYDEEIKHIASGIKFYCDQHRKTLFGEEKTATLLTGSVSYRKGKDSVDGKGLKTTIEKIMTGKKLLMPFNNLALKFSKAFLNLEYSVNKNQILKYPTVAKKLGFKIKPDEERFYVKPAEVDAEIEVAA